MPGFAGPGSMHEPSPGRIFRRGAAYKPTSRHRSGPAPGATCCPLYAGAGRIPNDHTQLAWMSDRPCLLRFGKDPPERRRHGSSASAKIINPWYAGRFADVSRSAGYWRTSTQSCGRSRSASATAFTTRPCLRKSIEASRQT